MRPDGRYISHDSAVYGFNIPAVISIVTMEMERPALLHLAASSERTAGLQDLLGMVYTWASQDSCTASYRLSIEPSYKTTHAANNVRKTH